MNLTAHVFPIADLHCDLLSYLARIPNANWNHSNDIGVSLPHLKQGNVRLQVMAIYTSTRTGSAAYAQKQVSLWDTLLAYPDVYPLKHPHEVEKVGSTDSLWILPAIENASGLCEEDEPLGLAWQRLEEIERRLGRILYISLTHHDENRFGGGNYSHNVGLKSDGKALLDHLDGKKIAVDLAHTSDQLASDILTYVDRQSLDIAIIASHSNFRPVWNHVRNLPEEIAREIIHRQGIIGINFLRSYIDDVEADKLFEHFMFGLKIGAEYTLALGADYFYTKDFHDRSRIPLYHKAHENAACYPMVMRKLQEIVGDTEQTQGIGIENIKTFLSRIWST
ncbi:MAG: membrane dipeptidase [Bacteroidota bacterium]